MTIETDLTVKYRKALGIIQKIKSGYFTGLVGEYIGAFDDDLIFAFDTPHLLRVLQAPSNGTPLNEQTFGLGIHGEVYLKEMSLGDLVAPDFSDGGTLYARDNGSLYWKNTNGTTYDLCSGGGGGEPPVIVFPFVLFVKTASVVIGDGVDGKPITYSMDGMELTDVVAVCDTVGATGSTDIQVRKTTVNGTSYDMLRTKITMSGERYCRDYTVNGTYKTVHVGEMIYVDVDAVETTPPKGLSVGVEFQ